MKEIKMESEPKPKQIPKNCDECKNFHTCKFYYGGEGCEYRPFVAV